MKQATRATLLKPTRAESKQAATDSTARSMIEAEAAARQKKTEHLRKMRLEVEAAAERQQAQYPRAAKRSKRRP